MQFQAAIGPLWSSWGERNYSLLLANEAIVAWPYTVRESWILAFALQIPFLKDPGHSFRERAVSDGVPDGEISDRDARRYSIETIREICVERRWSQNAVVIARTIGEPITFRLHNRSVTDDYRRLLGSQYSELYVERGFDGSPFAQAMKS